MKLVNVVLVILSIVSLGIGTDSIIPLVGVVFTIIALVFAVAIDLLTFIAKHMVRSKFAKIMAPGSDG
jgi:hypothetical protein